MHVPAYKLAAKELSSNHEQFTAYESKGHFVALAGPGSGKTKVLTAKLARIMSEDVEDPRGVACMTYSSECARELKRRIAKLGILSSRRTFIGTVHSFCFQHIVRPFAHLGGLQIANPICVATSDQKKNCFGMAVANKLGNNVSPWDWELPCSTYRRLHLDRDAPDWLADNKAAAHVIEEYERLLRSQGLIDFDDMMLLGLRLVEQHEWVRRALNSKFPVLVVDEYQDLGLPLHRLVMAMCFQENGPSTRLFAVGDSDQSIYGFTGAKPDLLRQLSERPDVETATLKLNYRSRQSLISASEVALGVKRGYKAAQNEDFGLIDFHECKDGLTHQSQHIVRTLVPEILASGTASCLGEIAVLYRTKSEGDVIDEEASKTGMEFIRVDNNAVYPKTPLTRWLEECAAWCTAGENESSPSLRSIIGDYLAFNQRLRSEATRMEATHKLVSVLRNSRNKDIQLSNWLATLAESCVRTHLLAEPTMLEEVGVLDRLIKNTENGGKLSDWSVARLGGQGGSSDHLNLMTLHSSKGLEFDVVILFGMDQGILPSYRETSPESKLEPRRLFYVGLTRARHEVHITYSGWRETPWGRRYNDGISEYVVELQSKLGESTK